MKWRTAREMNRLRLPLGATRSRTASVLSGKVMLMRLLMVQRFGRHLACTHLGCVGQFRARGPWSATLLQDPGAAGAAERDEIESRLDNGCAHHFDALEIARSDSFIFGEAQGTAPFPKRRGSA